MRMIIININSLARTGVLTHNKPRTLKIEFGVAVKQFVAVVMVAMAAIFVLVPSTSEAASLSKPNIGTAVAGKNYQILSNFGKPRIAPGKVEVVEYFWYGCPHCNRLEPYIENWAVKKPSYVVFRRVPVPFQGLWQVHARSFYAAQRLNVVDKTHQAFFDAIHKERKPLTNKKNIAKFYSEYGVNIDEFNEVYDSFGVDSKMRLALREVNFYKINSVPAVVVNGKYLLNVGMAGSEANLIEVIKQLAKLESENPLPSKEQG